jgi:hypothetical protein
MQVIWILYNPHRAHYDALVPAPGVDRMALLDLQKSVLSAVKQEARDSKQKARQLRYVNPPRRDEPYACTCTGCNSHRR